MPINIFFEVKTPASAEAPVLRKAAALALGAHARKPVNLVFSGEAGIKKLNRRFLGKDRLTDVIAFNFPPSPVPGADWGEIYVCVPVAARQAKTMGHSTMAELLVLTVHGALHLTGMDDSTPALRRAMNLKTAGLLKRL